LTQGERFCGACGRDSQAGASIPAVDPEVAFGLPPETSGKAIFSLICGILFIILPFSVVAVAFGHIALSEIRKNPGRLKGKPLAIAGIALGYVGVVLLVGFMGLGIYGIRKGQKEIGAQKTPAYGALAANENSVVSSIRTLNMAEIAYGQAHHEAGYTCSLSDLSGAWGISDDLATGRKNGYLFELKNCTAAKPGGAIAKYQLLVYSAEPAKAGKLAYCTDESNVIRMVRNGSPENCFKSGTELSVEEINNPQAPRSRTSPDLLMYAARRSCCGTPRKSHRSETYGGSRGSGICGRSPAPTG